MPGGCDPAGTIAAADLLPVQITRNGTEEDTNNG